MHKDWLTEGGMQVRSVRMISVGMEGVKRVGTKFPHISTFGRFPRPMVCVNDPRDWYCTTFEAVQIFEGKQISNVLR
jgi:hypothetical protein